MDEEENKIDFNQICRICLRSYKKLIPLFETDAPIMLRFCGFLEVIEGDDFPDKICGICNDMLLQSYKLKQLCLLSISYLQSADSSQKNSDAPNKYCHDTTNSEVDREHIIFEEDSSESEQTKKGEKVFGEHRCNISIDEDHSITSNNEPTILCNLLQPEKDLNTIYETDNEDQEKNTYHCLQCKMRFDYEQDSLAHQSVHSKDLNCNVCQKSFRTMKILKRHVKTHMIVKSHICKICARGFSESTALLKHMRLRHLRLPRDKKYACSECEERFTDQYYLNLHKRKHTGEKPFECNICSKSFYDPRSHKVHMDAHQGAKPYLCSHCGKSFVQSAHLRQHLTVHTKEKPYTCNICNKSFTQSTSLQRHQKLHRDMFDCYICSKRFPTKNQLLKHEKVHNADKINEVK